MHSPPLRRRSPWLHWPRPLVALSSSLVHPSLLPRQVRILGPLLFLLLGGVLIWYLPVQSLIAPASRPRLAQPAFPSARQQSATVLAVKPRGANVQLLVRSSPQQVLNLVITPQRHLVTRDGRALRQTSILPGDTLVGRPDQGIVDRSQVSVSLDGIVAAAPDPQGTSMILQIGSSRSIVVDIARGTWITGLTHRGAGSTIIQDADQVQVRGILDTVLGEMTQTDAVVRFGP